MAVHGFVERRGAEAGIHGVRELPGQDLARRPVHHRDQIEKATPQRDVGDVGTPGLVRRRDRQAPEQIGINLVLGRRPAGSGRLMDRLRAHQTHQPADPMPADTSTFTGQVTDDLPAAVEWLLHEQLVDPAH